MSNRIVAIRRFPVKSMGGEALDQATITPRGIDGDRVFAVIDGDGRFASGKNGTRFRRLDGIFGYRAWTASHGLADAGAASAADTTTRSGGADARSAPGADGSEDARGHDLANPRVFVARERRIRPSAESTGPRAAAPEFVDDPAGPWRIDDPALVDDLNAVVSEDVALYGTTGADFFDARPISLVGTATAAWAEREFGAADAARRLRANLLVETSEAFEEETWVNGVVAIGDERVACSVDQVISRCRMIDLPQDGVARQARFLQGLTDVRGPNLAVYLGVLRPGPIAVGDAVELDW